MKEFIEKNKNVLLIILVIIVIIVGISIFFIIRNNIKTKIHEIDRSNYSLKYDNTWKTVKEDDNEIELLHKKSKSKLDLKINELEDGIQYKSIDEIFDSLLYNIQGQNNNYKLIYKEKTKLTKNNIDGNKILFEANDSQAAIYFIKQGNKIAVITYEATYTYFDILLDSVNSIIYNFSIKEQVFNVTTSIKLETKEISYTEQEDISNLLNDTRKEEIASSNYLVNYSIPNNFKAIDYDTKYGSYRFENLSMGTDITLNTSILKCNLYEYLDREDSPNIYDSNLNSYNQAKETLNKFGEEPISYIYKNNYLSNNKITENITLVFELNNNHIFIVEISSNGIGIPEKLVKMIKINKIENIASNIKIEKKDGYLIGNLKRFTDFTYEQTEEITLKIPENYQELDKDNNLYKERHYVLNYSEEKDNYEYEISYETNSLSIESELKILDDAINKDYGKYKDFSPSNDITIDNRNFKVYERGYTALSNATDEEGYRYKYYTNEKVLFYELQNNNYLVIIIKGNDNTISDELINKLLNFDIKIK